jgi:hypothetical protein
MDTEQNLEARLALMSDEEKQHFKMVILELIQCYGPDGKQAVILFHGSNKLGGIVTLNCDAMEAAELLLEANDFFGFLNTVDAPPKEAFN